MTDEQMEVLARRILRPWWRANIAIPDNPLMDDPFAYDRLVALLVNAIEQALAVPMKESER